MPERETNVEVTSHPDGKVESIINDSGGKQVGVTVSMNKNEFSKRNNPMHLSGVTNEKMKEFEKIMRGDQTQE